MKIWQKNQEEILTLLDELILQQHLKAMAGEEGRGNKVPSAAVWHQPYLCSACWSGALDEPQWRSCWRA